MSKQPKQQPTTFPPAYLQDIRLAMAAMRDYAVQATREGLDDSFTLTLPGKKGEVVIATVADVGVARLGANAFTRGMITAAVRATAQRLTLVQLEAAAVELLGQPDLDTRNAAKVQA